MGLDRVNPGLPQIVNANAILEIFATEGFLFGIMALFFFLIPVLLSNLKLIGSDNELLNKSFFWIGIVIFDVVVSVMVAMNADEIKNLLVGQQSQLEIWQVIFLGEFWLIFIFGMFPLIITHYLIDSIVNSYNKSRRHTVDAEKNKQIQVLDKDLLDLELQKRLVESKIIDKEGSLRQKNGELESLEREINTQKNNVEKISTEALRKLKIIYDDYHTRIISGKIFTDEIMNSVTTAYKSGFIEYLPELYAEREVANRVRQIEQVNSNTTR